MASKVTKIRRDSLQFVWILSEGGFSTVYHMTWRSTEGPIGVAAKKLLQHDPHELNVLSTLDHPNIVKLLGVVDKEIDCMLILELCKRGSLRSYLNNLGGNGLPDKQFFEWAEQAARPLEYLRQRELIHKDIKSPNYMITIANILKLGDFGLAKAVNTTTKNATDRASHRWMAPELLEKSILSPKYDIFAFAVVLWEMRTGKVPFEGWECQVVMMKVINNKERLPIPDDCPNSIKDLMQRCWEEDWTKRPDIKEVINVITSEATIFRERQKQKTIDGFWTLERRIGSGELTDVRGVAVSPSNGDVAVCCRRAVKVYEITGDYKFTIDTTQGLQPGGVSCPWQVAINPEGTTYFVTDRSKHVKCYDPSGDLTSHWVSLCLEDPTDAPELLGLAIDMEGHVLVGDSNKYINVHKQNGCYIRSIQVGIEPMHIAVASCDDIVVARWFNPPQIVSKTGQVVHILKHPQGESQWNPRGVCCQRDVILVANTTYESLQLLCYSVSSGEYLGDAGAQMPPIFPHGITMAADDSKVVVCKYNGVTVYSL